MGENHSPLVSIIIITFNDRKYVGQAINSALTQTYPNCEVIVIDDGSTDGTADMITKEFGDKVHYYWKENGGMGSARFSGLKHASGKYIQHLDSDDLLISNKIELQLNFLEKHPEYAFVYGRTLCFYDDNLTDTWEHPSTKFHKSGNLLNEILLNGNTINVGQTLTQKDWIDRIGNWDPEVRGCDDQDIMIRLAYAGASGMYLDTPVYLYRHSRSLKNPSVMVSRHNLLERGRGEIYVWEKLYERMLNDKHKELGLVRRRLSEKYFSFGKLCLGNLPQNKSIALFRKSILLNHSQLLRKFMYLLVAIIIPRALFLGLKSFLKRTNFYKRKIHKHEI